MGPEVNDKLDSKMSDRSGHLLLRQIGYLPDTRDLAKAWPQSLTGAGPLF